MSTLSEYVMAHYLAEFGAGRDDSERSRVPPLDCGNGVLLSIEPAERSLQGPWGAFRVLPIGKVVPKEFEYPHVGGRTMQSGDIVRLLERLGWPEAQLGKRWKKRGGRVPAER